MADAPKKDLQNDSSNRDSTPSASVSSLARTKEKTYVILNTPSYEFLFSKLEKQ